MTHKDKLLEWIAKEQNENGLLDIKVVKSRPTLPTEEEAFCKELLDVIHAPKTPITNL